MRAHTVSTNQTEQKRNSSNWTRAQRNALVSGLVGTALLMSRVCECAGDGVGNVRGEGSFCFDARQTGSAPPVEGHCPSAHHPSRLTFFTRLLAFPFRSHHIDVNYCILMQCIAFSIGLLCLKIDVMNLDSLIINK